MMSRKTQAQFRNRYKLLRQKWLKVQIQRNQAFLALRLARDQIKSYEDRLGTSGVSPINMKIDEIINLYGEEQS